MNAHRCGNCGSVDLEWTSGEDLTCRHCGTRYRKVPKAAPKVVIKRGANVVFGPNAKVKIKGGMDIEDGANVRIEGSLEFDLEIVELGKPREADQKE